MLHCFSCQSFTTADVPPRKSFFSRHIIIPMSLSHPPFALNCGRKHMCALLECKWSLCHVVALLVNTLSQLNFFVFPLINCATYISTLLIVAISSITLMALVIWSMTSIAPTFDISNKILNIAKPVCYFSIALWHFHKLVIGSHYVSLLYSGINR